MIRAFFIAAVCAWALAAAAVVRAETTAAVGSPSFCLFQLPADDSGRQRWINLAIVQYVEMGRSELRIAYGGGSFGAGYEVHIPIASSDEAQAQIERMRQTAAACR